MTTTISPERLAELRAMPYEEYLTTPEWQATRKRILKRDNYQCQGCHAKHVALNVHHYTYERLGCEEDTDLVTLCVDCHEELHRRLADPPHLPFLYKCGIGAAAAVLGTIGIEGFLQAPLPAEIGVLIGAFLLAKNSPKIYGALKEKLPEEVMGYLGQAPREKKAGEVSTLDIWLGRQPKRQPGETSVPNVSEEDEDSYDEEDNDEIDDDLNTLILEPHKGIRVFSELLKTGWRPSMERVYVGTDRSGNHLFVPVKKLWHVALAGATGHGKSSLMRLLMVQLCYLKLPVILLNPHYMIYDFDHREDWTPYTPYLKNDPMVYKRMENIERALKWMAEELLEKRKERASQGLSAGKPVFYILDEYPDIKAEVKEAPTYVGKLLRQGRKYGIYLIVASQNYDVKTLGVEGEGGVRKCFRTIFYVGGDPVSVKELLNKAVRDIPENELGQGTIVLKCAAVKDPLVVHVPYLDNESLYLLLGPSTYVKPVQEEVHTDELGDVELEDTKARVDMRRAPTAATPNESATIKPNIPDSGPKADDIDINVLCACWNGGANSVSKIENLFKISHREAYKAYKRIKAQKGEPVEEQE